MNTEDSKSQDRTINTLDDIREVLEIAFPNCRFVECGNFGIFISGEAKADVIEIDYQNAAA